MLHPQPLVLHSKTLVVRSQVSSDCKERGDLFGVLWEHFWLVVSFRDSLLAEKRLQELQGEYRAAQAVSEGLRQEIEVRGRARGRAGAVAGTCKRAVKALGGVQGSAGSQ